MKHERSYNPSDYEKSRSKRMRYSLNTFFEWEKNTALFDEKSFCPKEPDELRERIDTVRFCGAKLRAFPWIRKTDGNKEERTTFMVIFKDIVTSYLVSDDYPSVAIRKMKTNNDTKWERGSDYFEVSSSFFKDLYEEELEDINSSMIRLVDYETLNKSEEYLICMKNEELSDMKEIIKKQRIELEKYENVVHTMEIRHEEEIRVVLQKKETENIQKLKDQEIGNKNSIFCEVESLKNDITKKNFKHDNIYDYKFKDSIWNINSMCPEFKKVLSWVCNVNEKRKAKVKSSYFKRLNLVISFIILICTNVFSQVASYEVCVIAIILRSFGLSYAGIDFCKIVGFCCSSSQFKIVINLVLDTRIGSFLASAGFCYLIIDNFGFYCKRRRTYLQTLSRLIYTQKHVPMLHCSSLSEVYDTNKKLDESMYLPTIDDRKKLMDMGVKNVKKKDLTKKKFKYDTENVEKLCMLESGINRSSACAYDSVAEIYDMAKKTSCYKKTPSGKICILGMASDGQIVAHVYRERKKGRMNQFIVNIGAFHDTRNLSKASYFQFVDSIYKPLNQITGLKRLIEPITKKELSCINEHVEFCVITLPGMIDYVTGSLFEKSSGSFSEGFFELVDLCNEYENYDLMDPLQFMEINLYNFGGKEIVENGLNPKLYYLCTLPTDVLMNHTLYRDLHFDGITDQHIIKDDPRVIFDEFNSILYKGELRSLDWMMEECQRILRTSNSDFTKGDEEQLPRTIPKAFILSQIRDMVVRDLHDFIGRSREYKQKYTQIDLRRKRKEVTEYMIRTYGGSREEIMKKKSSKNKSGKCPTNVFANELKNFTLTKEFLKRKLQSYEEYKDKLTETIGMDEHLEILKREKEEEQEKKKERAAKKRRKTLENKKKIKERIAELEKMLKDGEARRTDRGTIQTVFTNEEVGGEDTPDIDFIPDLDDLDDQDGLSGLLDDEDVMSDEEDNNENLVNDDVMEDDWGEM